MSTTPQQSKPRTRTAEQKAKRAAAERERRKRPEVKARQREHWDAWAKKNPDYKEPKTPPRVQRTRSLKHKYGLTGDAWDDLFNKQGCVCALCGADAPGGHGSWHTDHCHETGAVRGILCHHCNLMLGNARDNVTTLSNAIEYLKKYGESTQSAQR